MSFHIAAPFIHTRSMLCMLFMCFVLAQVPIQVSGQSLLNQRKSQLESQMKKLQNEIKSIEKDIKNTSAKKQKSMSEILSLQAKIRSREKLINNINEQIGDLDETIDATGNEIAGKNAEVEKMKQEYAHMLRKSYENITLQNQVAFLLSSNSFYEAMLRYNYLLKIAEYRRNQAKAIQDNIAILQVKRDELQQTKEQKVVLLERQTEQKTVLEKEKKNKDVAVSQLQEKEKKLKKQIEAKSAAAKQLNGRIQAIIEEEIRLARKKAEERAQKAGGAANGTVKKDVIPLTPQEQALSKDFASNMGKLPWPVLRGHVISPFGKHEHPAVKGVIVENNGVDIKSEPGADARSLFDGQVVSVFSLPTTHYCVIVKHGEYFTVYSNLETVSVKADQKVTVKQSIGKLYTDKADDLTKVHVEIWKGKEKMDPEKWLAD